MVSALLPGVREFRTPLVTGILWAACLWLLVGMPIAGSRATKEFVSRFGLDTVPPSGWLAAVVLLIYLVGSLLVVRTSPVSWLSRRLKYRLAPYLRGLEVETEPEGLGPRLLRRVLLDKNWTWRWKDRADRWIYDGQRYQAVDGWLHNEFQSMVAEGRVPVMRSFEGGCDAPNGFEAFYTVDSMTAHPAIQEPYDIRAAMSQNFVNEVKQEQSAVEVRIQMRFPEVYAEIDRLKVEAELRMSIFWPLMILSVLLSFAWSPLALLALLIPPLLLRDGFKRLQEASEKTWGALVAGEVTSPILDAMASAKNAECRDFRARQRGQDVGDEGQPSVEAVS